MAHIIEPASTGRAKCRGCGQNIARGELRFGERMPNPFGDGEATLWFHPRCAAYKRPEPLLEALAETADDVPDRAQLEQMARGSLAQRRLPRIDGAERASSSKAKCRSCYQPIERASWRIRLVFFEEGMFNPGGFIHPACGKAYFETDDFREQVLYFSTDLSDQEREDLRGFLSASSV